MELRSPEIAESTTRDDAKAELEDGLRDDSAPGIVAHAASS